MSDLSSIYQFTVLMPFIFFSFHNWCILCSFHFFANKEWDFEINKILIEILKVIVF